MKLIVGLGNPGSEYNNTRHNVGFSFLDYYLEKKNIKENWSKKYNSLLLQTYIDNNKVIFLKPQTYMNLSGEAVKKVMDYYKISVDDLLIISDDLDIIFGNFKLKSAGSSGGHNGLKNIELMIGTNNYKRLKIGISKSKEIDTKSYVLSSFSVVEKDKLLELFLYLVDVLDDYFVIPFGDLMSKYNQKNR